MRSPRRSASITLAGAAALAAALKLKDRLKGKKVGILLTGGNIDLELFGSWVLGERR